MKKGYINTVMLSCLCSASQQLNKAEPLNKDTFRATRRVGFTLVELLVVVLIIGVLSAIAIPMYQGAVDKSHWSTMLPGAKAIKDAEEAIKMTNGAYTDNMANLDVTMNNSDLTFTLVTPNNTADPNVIRVTNSKLNNVRLASYLDQSPMFAGQLHCEALKNDERANKLCGKLLMGQELTEQDGYVGYLLDQAIDKSICDNASRSWSTSKTKCYKTTAERCTGLGSEVITNMNDQCGYVGSTGGKPIGEEEICLGNSGYTPCINTTINQGGTCEASGGTRACYSAKINSGGICHATNDAQTGCESVIVNPGGVCIGDSTNSCGLSWYAANTGKIDGGICVGNGVSSCTSGGSGPTFINGAICYANNSHTCGHNWSSPDASVFYDSTSCCCGNYCGNAPTCASRGIACDPQYMK